MDKLLSEIDRMKFIIDVMKKNNQISLEKLTLNDAFAIGALFYAWELVCTQRELLK